MRRPDPSLHSALEAWRALPGDEGCPRAIDLLKHRTASTVYRFDGIGAQGSSVIAKRHRGIGVHVERAVYERVLPSLPLPSVRYYGSIDEPAGEFSWTFVEDAGTKEVSQLDLQHRLLASRWLATAHISAHGRAAEAGLPDAGPDRYREHLRSVRGKIEQTIPNRRLTEADTGVLRRALGICDALTAVWGEIEAACSGMPRTLVHGDFVGKNARVRPGVNGPDFLPFDWETAGFGVPAADLAAFVQSPARLELDVYWSLAQAAWPQLGVDDLLRGARIGMIFRLLAGIDWASDGLVACRTYVERPLRRVDCFRHLLSRALDHYSQDA